MAAVTDYGSFCSELLRAGFSLGGGNPHGIYCAIPFSWEDGERADSPIRWHTGDAETDPWEWRIRVLTERSDVAYAKLFFRVAGYITREWYPYFYAVRRGNSSFDEAYADGKLSREAKRVYDSLRGLGQAPPYDIKRDAGITSGESGRFERALTELQAGMYITICGHTRKRDKLGNPYGWNANLFTTVESFWDDETIERARSLDPDAAREKIRERVFALNPAAETKTAERFIAGR